MDNDMQHASTLLSLPIELLQNILQLVDPQDIGPLVQTCRWLKWFIEGNHLLFKEIYLRLYDDPCQRPSDPELSWQTEIKDLTKLHKILASRDAEVKSSRLPFIAENVGKLLRTAKTTETRRASKNISLLCGLFNDKSGNQDAVLCRSSLFKHSGTDSRSQADTPEARLASAKLHCFYGVPIAVTGSNEQEARHSYARSRVYDLRRYTKGNFWGPFLDDGSFDADWEKLEAIIMDLAYNLRLFHVGTHGVFPMMWNKPFQGVTPYGFVSPPLDPNVKQPSPSVELDPPIDDPYGVTGTWMRVVCFVDYSELFDFNFTEDPPPNDEDRAPLFAGEAIRLLWVTVRAKTIEEPGEKDGKALPVVYFEGISRSMQTSWDENANSDISGTVRLTPEGQVRWTTLSVYDGEPRWKSECIQIGGLQTSRGVFGTWFDKDYDFHGPCGPTAFWKYSNEVYKKRPTSFRYPLQ